MWSVIARLLFVLVVAGLVMRAIRWLQAPRAGRRVEGADRFRAGRGGAAASGRWGEAGARRGRRERKGSEVIDVPFEDLPPRERTPANEHERTKTEG